MSDTQKYLSGKHCFRTRDSVAESIFFHEARRQSDHRCTTHEIGIGSRANLGDIDQTRSDRYAVPDQRQELLAHRTEACPTRNDPHRVAEAILHAAEHPSRDIFVGGGAVANAIGNNTPALADKLGEGVFIPGTYSDKPPHTNNSLDSPTERLAERGDYPGHVRKTSLYTGAVLNPPLVSSLAVGASILAVKWMGATRHSAVETSNPRSH